MKKRIIFFTLLFICGMSFFMYRKGNEIVHREFGVTVPDVISSMINGTDIVKSENGRVTILLLGIGGGDHDGSELTDTVIVASFSITSSPSVVLLSIPRDLWSSVLQDKINSAYYYGEEAKKGDGMSFAKEIIEQEIGIPIHYAMLLDFSRFKEIIDAIGGVTITVPQSFVDEEYPISGKEMDECSGDPTFACRYQTVEFFKGEEKMDGERALIYVRSRHAEGEVGNDFSRGKRQQDVLIAIKNKLFDRVTWTNPKAFTKLIQVFRDTVTTDMSLPEFISLGKTMLGRPHDIPVEQVTLESELQEGSFDLYGRFVLIPIGSKERFFSFIRSKIWPSEEGTE